MKVILCLLAVVCAVNADVYDKMMSLQEKLAPLLVAEGVDYDLIHAATLKGKKRAAELGLTEEEEEEELKAFLQDGCDNGFNMDGDYEALAAQLNGLSEILCPQLDELEAGAWEAMNHLDEVDEVMKHPEEMSGFMGDGAPVEVMDDGSGR